MSFSVVKIEDIGSCVDATVDSCVSTAHKSLALMLEHLHWLLLIEEQLPMFSSSHSIHRPGVVMKLPEKGEKHHDHPFV